MTNHNMTSFKDLYLKTAYEYMENLESGLIRLSHDPYDKEVIGEFYISVHSLKSQSSAMGYTLTATLCNIMEIIFREVKEGKKMISNELIKVLATSLGTLKKSIQSIEHYNKEIDLSSEINNLAHAAGVTLSS